MAQKANPIILRSNEGSYAGCTHWDEPKLFYTSTVISNLITSCCLNTTHYIDKVEIESTYGSITVKAYTVHLHGTSQRKTQSRRHRDNTTKSKKKSWPLVARRLQLAAKLIQRVTGAKKVAIRIFRRKVYTRAIPKPARKELSFFGRGFNAVRYNYARSGMQLMYLLLNGKAHATAFSRFLQENICSRQKRKRHYQFLGYIKQSLRALEPYKKVAGVKIQIKGRFTHKAKSRSRIWRCQIGSVPLSQLNKKIHFTYTQTQTAYGSVGIKVWICE